VKAEVFLPSPGTELSAPEEPEAVSSAEKEKLVHPTEPLPSR
jgi:hypothetical protein